MTRILAAWNRFWFAPVQSSTYAVLRIAFATVVLGWTLSLAPSLYAFYSADGILPEHPPAGWGVLELFPGRAGVTALYFLLLFASLFLLVGFRTRLAAVLVFVCLVSFSRRNPWVLNSGDLLLHVLAFYVMLAPTGAALSVDRWLKERGGLFDFPPRAIWPLRLMQIQLSVLYLAAVWAKVRGVTWNDGTAVSFALRIGDLERLPVPGFVTDSVLLVGLLTYGTLALELALGILVWNRVLRPWVLLLGVSLHLGIDYAVRVGFFSYAVLVLYIAFLPPEAVSARLLALRERLAGARLARLRRPASAILLYDADCGFCRWAVAKILARDRRRRILPLRLQGPEADDLLPGLDARERMRSWHLVTSDHRFYSGGAVAAPLLRLLPGGRPLALLAAVFPNAVERTYRLVATNRGRLGRLAGVERAGATARRERRRLGRILVALGVALVAYAAALVFWRDPATDLYARWKQHELAASLEQSFAAYEASAATTPTLVDVPTDRERLEAQRLAVVRAANALAATLEKGKPLGRLRIPKLGLDLVFVHGTRWGPDLSQGPGHYPQTSLPGVNRTMAIAGHRTTFGAPFRHIDSLQPGHLVELHLPYATFRYRVFRHKIVDNGDWSIIRDRGFDTLVLSACHPLYSAEQRWIVFARLVEVRPLRGQGYRISARGELASI